MTYIEELRKEIESLCGDCDRPNKEKLGEIILSSMALGFNAGLKAQSADRPQGEWIMSKPEEEGFGAVFQCSRCSCEVDCVPTNFCPNCGARMKGADDE